MTRETLMKMFEKNKNTNFRINTNIAQGKGINGVAFSSYIGEVTNSQFNEITNIVEFDDDCLVLKNKMWESYWQGGEHLIYLPYSSIVSVDFLLQHSNDSRFPLKLSFKHDFLKKKTNLKK